jgi:hypothetical protein
MVAGMTERRWFPNRADQQRIREHLERQRGVPVDRVRLDDGRVVRVGEEAEGEGDADVDE